MLPVCNFGTSNCWRLGEIRKQNYVTGILIMLVMQRFQSSNIVLCTAISKYVGWGL